MKKKIPPIQAQTYRANKNKKPPLDPYTTHQVKFSS